jgi:uncharacterized protein YjbJ (UPF0337 family)
MNKDILAGKWKELKGKVKEQWGELTDDEIDQMEGKADQLAGKLQAKYGYSKEDADNEVTEFLRKHDSNG